MVAIQWAGVGLAFVDRGDDCANNRGGGGEVLEVHGPVWDWLKEPRLYLDSRICAIPHKKYFEIDFNRPHQQPPAAPRSPDEAAAPDR